MGRSRIFTRSPSQLARKKYLGVEDDVVDLPLEDSIRRYGSVKWSGPSYPRVVATRRRRLPPAKVGGAWSSSRTDGMPLCICTEVEGPYSSVGVTENERSVLVARQVAESAELTFCVGTDYLSGLADRYVAWRITRVALGVTTFWTIGFFGGHS